MAAELLAQGDAARAAERAGEAVYLDPSRPEGFLLLGDIHLAELDTEEALTAYERGHEKAVGLGEEGQGLAALGLAGMAKALLLQGRIEAAAEVLERLLAEHPDEGSAAVSLLAHCRIELNRADAALLLLQRYPDPSDAGLHLAAALAYLRVGSGELACLAARRAFLANLHLLGALMEEETPDLGLLVGDERGSRETAGDLAERWGDYFGQDPKALDDLERIADNPVVEAELLAALEAARALNRERDPALRATLIERIRDLRSEARLLISNEAAAASLRGTPLG